MLDPLSRPLSALALMRFVGFDDAGKAVVRLRLQGGDDRHPPAPDAVTRRTQRLGPAAHGESPGLSHASAYLTEMKDQSSTTHRLLTSPLNGLDLRCQRPVWQHVSDLACQSLDPGLSAVVHLDIADPNSLRRRSCAALLLLFPGLVARGQPPFLTRHILDKHASSQISR